MSALDDAVPSVRRAPTDSGTLDLIVRRPTVGEREVLASGELDLASGLVGDSWIDRPSRHSPDGGPHILMQLNIMGSRAATAVAGTPDPAAWVPAGDQLFVDFDLSGANLAPGTRLAIGGAVIEVTEQPHTGCAQFTERFGLEAMRWVNSPVGRELNLRGICARVVQPGVIAQGDPVTKLDSGAGPGPAAPA